MERLLSPSRRCCCRRMTCSTKCATSRQLRGRNSSPFAASRWRSRSAKMPGTTSTSGTSGSTLSTRRSEEHTSELQSRGHLVCRLLLEKKKKNDNLLLTKQCRLQYRGRGACRLHC